MKTAGHSTVVCMVCMPTVDLSHSFSLLSYSISVSQLGEGDCAKVKKRNIR